MLTKIFLLDFFHYKNHFNFLLSYLSHHFLLFRRYYLNKIYLKLNLSIFFKKTIIFIFYSSYLFFNLNFILKFIFYLIPTFIPIPIFIHVSTFIQLFMEYFNFNFRLFNFLKILHFCVYLLFIIGFNLLCNLFLHLNL